MKHARLYIMFVFISFCAFSQNRPGIDYFPHTSFFDFSVQYLYPPNKVVASGSGKKFVAPSLPFFFINPRIKPFSSLPLFFPIGRKEKDQEQKKQLKMV